MLFPVLITLAYTGIAIAVFTALAALIAVKNLDEPRESSQQPRQEPEDEDGCELRIAA